MQHAATALNALRHIEQTGSLTKAAQLLKVSQPAVSKAIAAEEKLLGVQLLRRGTRPLRLTAEGELLARHAERSAEMLEAVLADIEARRRHQAGLVRVGSFGASGSTRILPGLLGGFRSHYPKIGVTITEKPNREIVADLRADLVDVAVRVEEEGEEFESIPLPSDRLVALVPADGPLAKIGAVSAAMFQQHPFIMSKGGSEPMIRQWFAQAGITPRIDHTVLQVTSIMALVNAGQGLSIMAEMALPALPPNVLTLPLSPDMPRHITMTRLRSAMRSTAAETFWHYAERNFGG